MFWITSHCLSHDANSAKWLSNITKHRLNIFYYLSTSISKMLMNSSSPFIFYHTRRSLQNIDHFNEIDRSAFTLKPLALVIFLVFLFPFLFNNYSGLLLPHHCVVLSFSLSSCTAWLSLQKTPIVPPSRKNQTWPSGYLFFFQWIHCSWWACFIILGHLPLGR